MLCRALAIISLFALASCSPARDVIADQASQANSAVSSALETSSREEARVLGGVNLDAPMTMLGTEPFWNIGFGNGRIVFSSPDSHEGRTTSEPFFFSPEGAEWHGKGMDIYLTAAHCSDGMSDRRYPLTAIVHIGQTKLKGCAAATTSFSGDRKMLTRPASNP
jgi:uncharacterized membrane protein